MKEEMKLKIVMLGDGAVGKTSIVRKYLGWGFTQDYIPTVGANFYEKEKTYEYPKKDLTLTIDWVIWDVSGQPAFHEVRKNYYYGAKGALMVTDLTRTLTLQNAENWIDDFFDAIDTKIPVVFLGNKKDLTEKHMFSSAEGEKIVETLSKQYGKDFEWIETSAKTGENLNTAFKELGFEIARSLEKV